MSVPTMTMRRTSSSLPPASTRRSSIRTVALPVRPRSQQRVVAPRSVKQRTLAATGTITHAASSAAAARRTDDSDSDDGEYRNPYLSPPSVTSDNNVQFTARLDWENGRERARIYYFEVMAWRIFNNPNIHYDDRYMHG